MTVGLANVSIAANTNFITYRLRSLSKTSWTAERRTQRQACQPIISACCATNACYPAGPQARSDKARDDTTPLASTQKALDICSLT